MTESTTNQQPLKIFIFGGGSLGGLYGHLLSTSKSTDVQITVACRGNYDAVSQSGFTLTTNNWGNHAFRPHRVVHSPAELPAEAYDYVLVTTKVLSQPGEPPLTRFALPPAAPIVLIQNGVGIEEPYRAAFPHNPIASAVAYITACQPSPGHILQYGTIATMSMGLYDRPNPADRAKIQRLATLIDDAGFQCEATDTILVDRWGKLGWNVSWNVVCAATNLDTQSFLASSPQAVQLVESIIREVARTANAAGVTIDADQLVKDRMGWTMKAPPIVPSMLQDARKGMPMELEAYCGNVWRIAESLGVEVPCIKSMYTILATMNWRFKNASKTATANM